MKIKVNKIPTQTKNLEFKLDLETASNAAFDKLLDDFYAWSDTQPDPAPFDLEPGWYEVNPFNCQDFLRLNVCNRPPSLASVKKYNYSMASDDWRLTGQGIVFNERGKMNEGGQRSLAGYLGNVSFKTYIVTGVPDEEDMFAYYDDVKPRTGG